MDLKHCLDASSVQVMNAGPLPLNPYLTYRPHDSFDERGYLRPEAYEAKVSEYVRQRQYNPGIWGKYRKISFVCLAISFYLSIFLKTCGSI